MLPIDFSREENVKGRLRERERDLFFQLREKWRRRRCSPDREKTTYNLSG